MAQGQAQVPEVAKIAEEMYLCGKRLSKSADALYTLAKEYAESEREYRISLAIKIQELKETERATLVENLAKGDKKVADLKYKRDIAEFRYKAGKESVGAISGQLSSLQTIFKRQTEV